MYLHKSKKPNGDIYLTIKEKYHVPKVGAREKTVESIGYVSALKEKYDDPIAFFTQKAMEMTAKKKKEKAVSITIDTCEKMKSDTDDIRNVGYGILKQIYKDLEIDKFWNWKTRNLSVEFSVDQIFRLLVFPASLLLLPRRGLLITRHFILKISGIFPLMMSIMRWTLSVRITKLYRNGFLITLNIFTVVIFLFPTLTVPTTTLTSGVPIWILWMKTELRLIKQEIQPVPNIENVVPKKITVLIPLLKWDYSWTAMVYLLHLTCFRETSQKKSI